MSRTTAPAAARAAVAAGCCALAVGGAGCGSSHPTGLAQAARGRLTAFVARARRDAVAHDRAGVLRALGGFISSVQAMQAVGALSASAAANLESQARAAERAARAQLAGLTSSTTLPAAQLTTTATRGATAPSSAPASPQPPSPAGRPSPPGHGPGGSAGGPPARPGRGAHGAHGGHGPARPDGGPAGDGGTVVTDPPPRRLTAGLRLAERYRLERVLGAGGMGVVWRATDEVLERPVAIKAMSDALAADDAYLARFGREARLAAGISHPNLVGVFDYSADGDPPYLVMEYVDGGTLTQRLESGRLAGAETGQLAHDLLAALCAVHAAGVLHRDIKPGNVLLGRDGRARLTDFGVARLEGSGRLTQTGHVVGTLRYLAPEVVAGAEASPRADLYALGVLLGEVTTKVRGDPRVARLADWLAAAEPEERPEGAEQALGWLDDEDPAGRVAAPSSTLSGIAAQRRAPRTRTQTTLMARLPRIRSRLAAALLGAIVLAVVVALTLEGGSGSRASGATSSARRSGGVISLDRRLQQLERSVRAAGSP